MGNLWTEEQKQVIWLRNRNILVSAAAGSGKTAVLVERILQKITDREHPVDIDRLLIVTFTRAAAAEMRERITRICKDRKRCFFMHRSRRSTVSVSRCFGHIFIWSIWIRRFPSWMKERQNFYGEIRRKSFWKKSIGRAIRTFYSLWNVLQTEKMMRI